MHWIFAKTTFVVAGWIVLTLAQSANALSSDKNLYYGKDFLSHVQAGHIQDEDLLQELFIIIKNAHIKSPGQPDQIVPDCQTIKLDKTQRCTQHQSLGYDRARKIMFGTIHLEKMADGNYAVKDAYCEKYFTNSDFNDEPGNIGPGMIPSNGAILNTEHTWPQSRFTGRFNKDLQKSDLHHLYPTDSEMNSRRGALQFGEVADDLEKLKCPQNRLGRRNLEKGTVFEPPVAHRGNVARAVFYFAVRYQMKIGSSEEATLKKWNKEDPVDEFEMKRNDLVEKYQGNRNPFIDYPEFADQVKSFTFSTTK